ncbi:peptide chain release factor N(5)-glutamine methyltransferase [Candidatus Peregrinibacteria bacterium]|nr:peptide chain release factor N(5)-glutamine methyltransferase [Candidatus Peregrinibacteria bacterium]
MLVTELIQRSSSVAKSKECVSYLECELLLAHVLNISRERLFVSYQERLSSHVIQKFYRFFHRLQQGEPLAYLLGEKQFYGLDFYVDRRVLIPRPETELLVDEILKFSFKSGFHIVDVGTGSGNIAISLAFNLRQKFDNFRITALDVCFDALKVCEKNIHRFQLSDKVFPLQNNLLEGLERESFDIIVANLPYIGTEIYSFVSQSTYEYEPNRALFGGKDGLFYYRELFSQIVGKRHQPRFLIGEIGSTQGFDILRELYAFFPFSDIFLRQDLSGFDRMFIVKFL